MRSRKLDLSKFPEQTKQLLDAVFHAYGQYTVWALNAIMQNEPPFRYAELNKAVDLETMRNYFSTQLIHEKSEDC